MNPGFSEYTLEELLPHRPPMLLIDDIIHIDDSSSQALVHIQSSSPFFEDKAGVPAWIGIEYMGQTAALIAGYQQQRGSTKTQLGFLLGTRAYSSEVDYFAPESKLLIACEQTAMVGEELATFRCTISQGEHQQTLAEASLSVLRK